MKNNLLYHVGWWFFFWGVPLVTGGRMPKEFAMPLYAYLINLGVMVLCSTLISYANYHNLYYSFEKRKYLTYVYSVLGAFIVAVAISQWLLIPHLREPKLNIFKHITGNLVSLVLSTLFWFAQKGYAKELEFKEAKTKRVEAEMGLLKMQIQPHFLFNTLNNVYATNLQNPAKANEMILQLADLLRYQLEITRQEKITLQEEIRLTESYIALEKIRLHNCEVVVEKEGHFEAYSIAPLLFLPLVENAFKYSTDIQKSHIYIRFTLQNNCFTFCLSKYYRAKQASQLK